MSRWIIPILVAVGCSGQAQPAFEVVSIKALDANAPFTVVRPVRSPGRVHLPRTNLWGLIMQAYGVKRYQIEGPAWMDSQWYEFSATIPEGVAADQVPLMLQAVLRDRFGLKVHRESKEQSVYALVVGKGGPKLKKSPEDARNSTFGFSTTGHMDFKRTSMAGFAQALSGQLGRPVLDQTGLEGYFDIVLDVNPGDLEGMQKSFAAVAAVTENNSMNSLFAAIQELGLKLESRKAPIEHVVIDHVEKVPTAN